MELQILLLSISVRIEFSLHAIKHAFFFLKLCNQLWKVRWSSKHFTYNYNQFPSRLVSTRAHWSFSSLQQELPRIFQHFLLVLQPSLQASFTAPCGLPHSMIIAPSLLQSSFLDCHQLPLLIAKVSIKFGASHYQLYLDWSLALAFIFLFLHYQNFFYDYQNVMTYIHHVENDNGH